MAQSKFRYWQSIIYPESAPSDWLQLLTDTGLPCCISPLHNRDIDDDGSLKKPHYHILICFSGPTTYNNVLSIIQMLGSSVLKEVYSVKGCYEYWIHKNNPDKAQYSSYDRISINGFSIDNYYNLTAQEALLLSIDIDNDIVLYNITEYSVLRLFYLRTDYQKYKWVNNHSILYKTYFFSLRAVGGGSAVSDIVNNMIKEKIEREKENNYYLKKIYENQNNNDNVSL